MEFSSNALTIRFQFIIIDLFCNCAKSKHCPACAQLFLLSTPRTLWHNQYNFFYSKPIFRTIFLFSFCFVAQKLTLLSKHPVSTATNVQPLHKAFVKFQLASVNAPTANTLTTVSFFLSTFFKLNFLFSVVLLDFNFYRFF